MLMTHTCNPNQSEDKKSGGLQFEGNPGQIVCQTLSLKNPAQKSAGGMAQSEGPEFKP
jgi:hypothetical protein